MTFFSIYNDKNYHNVYSNLKPLIFFKYYTKNYIQIGYLFSITI